MIHRCEILFIFLIFLTSNYSKSLPGCRAQIIALKNSKSIWLNYRVIRKLFLRNISKQFAYKLLLFHFLFIIDTWGHVIRSNLFEKIHHSILVLLLDYYAMLMMGEWVRTNSPRLSNHPWLLTTPAAMPKLSELALKESRKNRICCARDPPRSVVETSCRAGWNCRAQGPARLTLGRLGSRHGQGGSRADNREWSSEWAKEPIPE